MKYNLLLVAWAISLTITQAYSQDTLNRGETEQKITNLVRTYLDSELKSEVPKLASYSIDSIEIIPYSEKQKIKHDVILEFRRLQKLKTKMEKLQEQYTAEPSNQLSEEIKEIKAIGSKRYDEANQLLETAEFADSIDTVCYSVTILTSVKLLNGIKRTNNLFFRVSNDFYIILKPEEFIPEIYSVFND